MASLKAKISSALSSKSSEDPDPIKCVDYANHDNDNTSPLTPSQSVRAAYIAHEHVPDSPADTASVFSAYSTATQAANADGKRMKQFEDLFGDHLEPGEELVAHWSCRSQDRLPIAGRLFVSQKHIAFKSNVMGFKKRFIFDIADITAIHRRMSALVVPDGLTISLCNGDEHIFGTLLAREATRNVILSIWRDVAPIAYQEFNSSMGNMDGDTTIDVMPKPTSGSGEATPIARDDASVASVQSFKEPTKAHTKHYKNKTLDIRLPTLPEKVWELMYLNEEFITNFWTETQKLEDVDVDPWEGPKPLQKRTLSYIKPLSGPVGPSKTKCRVREQIKNADSEVSYEVLAITRTLDVPYGDSFEVQTLTTITHAGGVKGGTSLRMSTDVEWSGRCMLKGVITKASIQGQRHSHTELARAIRMYIKNNPQDFACPETSDIDDELQLDEPPEEEISHVRRSDSLFQKVVEGLMDAPQNPAIVLLSLMVIGLLISNFILLTKSKHPAIQLEASAEDRLKAVEKQLDTIRKALC